MKTKLSILIFLISIKILGQTWEQTSGPYSPFNLYSIYNIDSSFIAFGYTGAYESNCNNIQWMESNIQFFNSPVKFNDTMLVLYGIYLKSIKKTNGQFNFTDWSNNYTPLGFIDTIGNYLVASRSLSYSVPSLDVLISQDGHHFTVFNNGLPYDSFPFPPGSNTWDHGVHINDIASLGNKAFVTNSKGVYSSIMGVFDWSPSNVGLPIGRASQLFTYNNLIFVNSGNSIYRSLNQGQSWILSYGGQNGENPKIVNFRDTLFILANSQKLIFSTDLGSTWSYSDVLLGNQMSNIFAFDNILFILSQDSGLFGYYNHWEKYIYKVFKETYQLLSNDSTLLCTEDKIFVTTDNGINWSHTADSVRSLGIIDKIGSKYYLSFVDNVYHSVGLYNSLDNGFTWSYLPANLTLYGNPYYLVTNKQDKILMCYGTTNLVFLSSDLGMSYTNISPTQSYMDPQAYLFNNDVISIPFQDGYHNYNIYNSFDFGESWQLLNNIYTQSLIGAILTPNNLLFFSFANDGVYVSSDFGVHLNSSNYGLPSFNTAKYFSEFNSNLFISIKPANSNYFNKVYFSNDYGAHWNDISSNLDTDINVRKKVVFNNCLYASTSKGVWKRNLDDVILSNPPKISSLSPFTIFPNPTNGKFKINCSETIDRIEVHDSNGAILKVFNDRKNLYDITELSNGIYFLRLYYRSVSNYLKIILIN